jgi:1,4-dihydroxy-2-naphthoate polyprenyltransferase
MVSQFVLWLRALRAPFFQAVIISVALGTAIAWQQTRVFHFGYFLLALIGVIFIHAGTNLSNDYFDHKSRADDKNKGFTPFSGGSRVIQDGLISARKILIAAILFFFLASVIGFYLTAMRGWSVLIIGIIGVLSGYLYTASPVKFVYRGWGELVVALNCGPLIVMGAYYVQVQHLSWRVLLASLPIGLLTAGILYINQFSDYDADKAAGKQTLVVKLGLLRAVYGYYLLLGSVFIIIAITSLMGLLPRLSLACLVALPFAIRAAQILRVNYAGGKKMIPAMASNIFTHLLVGVLLSSSYIVTGIMI